MVLVTTRSKNRASQSFKNSSSVISWWGPEGFNLLNVVNPVVQVEAFRRRRMRELGFPDKFREAGRYHTADDIEQK